MLSVILGILKIIGIILGILVLLLLLGICAVCFVPIRYRISLRKEEDVLEGAVRVSWLFRLFTFTIGYQEKKIVRSIRIFAVPIEKWTALIGRIANRKKARTQKKKRRKPPGTGRKGRSGRRQQAQQGDERRPSVPPQGEEGKAVKLPQGEESEPSMPLQGEESEPSVPLHGEEGKAIKPPQADEAPPHRPPQAGTAGEQGQFWLPPPGEEKNGAASAGRHIRRLLERIYAIIRSMISLITGLPARISGFLSGCKGKAETLHRTLAHLMTQANYYLKLWQHEQTRAVTARMKGRLFYLFTHYRPRSIDGYLKLGFEDPASTGQAVGLIYLIMPVKKGRFSLEPDFHQAVLEGNLTIRGYIRGVHGIKTALSLIFDKELKLTIKRIRRKGGPSDGR